MNQQTCQNKLFSKQATNPKTQLINGFSETYSVAIFFIILPKFWTPNQVCSKPIGQVLQYWTSSVTEFQYLP